MYIQHTKKPIAVADVSIVLTQIDESRKCADRNNSRIKVRARELERADSERNKRLQYCKNDNVMRLA